MDFGKIKTIFIYLFLILNTVLFCVYLYTVNKNKTEIYQERDAIIQSIKNGNIEIIEPNQKKEEIGYISATTKNFDVSQIQGNNFNYEIVNEGETKYLSIKFENPIANIKDSNYKEKLDTFIKENNLAKELYYIYENYDEKNKKVIYVQAINSLKIYDNKNARIEFYVDGDGKIKSMTQTGLVNLKKDNVENIASYTQAIYKLYHENYIPNNSKVYSSLGYYTSVSQLKNQVLIPSWKIEIFDGENPKIYYIDAVNIKILDKNKKQ